MHVILSFEKNIRYNSVQVINFDSPRGGISLVTEKGPETTSRLMIQKAVPSDSGIYRCEPSNANPSSIKVHVVNGKLKFPTYTHSIIHCETIIFILRLIFFFNFSMIRRHETFFFFFTFLINILWFTGKLEKIRASIGFTAITTKREK